MDEFKKRFGKIRQDLQDLVADIYRKEFAKDIPEEELKRVGIDLNFDNEDSGDSFAIALEKVHDFHIYNQPSFEKHGRVYCYRCQDYQCSHSLPPDRESIFAGYTSSGQPDWQNYATFVLDVEPEHGSLLFEKSAPVIVLLQRGKDLRRKQLRLFGKTSQLYSVLGQVSSGYYNYEGQRLAISLQMAEVRGGGKSEVILNIISYLSDPVALDEFLNSRPGKGLLNGVQFAKREIESINKALKGKKKYKERSSILGQIPRIMRQTRQRIEKQERRTKSSTQHARDRRLDNRPVGKAKDDIAATPLHKWLWDSRSETYVIPAAKGRVHVFNTDGKHVTSLNNFESIQIQKRMKSGRWIPLSEPNRFKAMELFKISG